MFLHISSYGKISSSFNICFLLYNISHCTRITILLFNAPKKEIQMYEKEELHWNSTSSLSARSLPVFLRHLTSLCGILLCLVFYRLQTTVWPHPTIYQEAKKNCVRILSFEFKPMTTGWFFQGSHFFASWLKVVKALFFCDSDEIASKLS